MQLEKKGILRECRVKLLGTSSASIERAEDRELFKELCQSIGEPVIPSEITYSIDEAKEAAKILYSKMPQYNYIDTIVCLDGQKQHYLH